MRIYKNHSNGRSVGWNEYHLEWCTKYRYKIFSSSKYKNFCKVLITESCKCYNLELIDYEIDVDHIHVLVSIPLTLTPIKALNYLKGYTSRCMFILVPKLRKIYPKGHLWSPGKFVGSVDHITLEKAKDYVNKHNIK